MMNRLKELRLSKRVSQAKIADLLGVTQATVSKIEQGAVGLNPAKVEKLCQFFGVEPGLLLGIGAPSEGQTLNINPATGNNKKRIAPSSFPRDIPVIGGTVGGAEGDFSMNGQTVDFVRRPPALDGTKDVFALYVQGDSMSPWKEPGQLIYLNSSRPPRPGDYVVLELHSEDDGKPGKCFLKRLIRRTPSKIIVGQHNPKRDDIEFPLIEIQALYRVYEIEDLLGV
ncbi:MAG: helix-turn-helix domain-containing protein [Kiloniellales bacterium]